MSTIDTDTVNFNDAEDFRLPSSGVHNGTLQAVEFGPTKAGDREQFTLTTVLAHDDPDSPNLPMRYYAGWPVPEDKEIMWGTRTAYGAKVKALRDLMTAFGGPESGSIDKARMTTFLEKQIGSSVKVNVKTGLRADTGEPSANVAALLPA